MPSYSCPLAESHPGPWGLQEAGRQAEGCQLQRGKEKKGTRFSHIFSSQTDCVCVYPFMCVPVHVCAQVCSGQRMTA